MRNRSVLLTRLVVALVPLLWLLLTGVGPVPAVLVTGALAVQTTAGAHVWALISQASGRRVDVVESLGMGFAIGSFAAMAAGVVLRPVMPGGWGWLVPSVVVLAVAGARRWRHRRARGVLGPAPAFVSVGVMLATILGLVGAAVNLVRYPLSWVGELSTYHPDMLFFEGLSTSLALYGPSDSIFMVGTELRYHWFAYAWIGQIATSLDLAPFVGLTRVLPVATVLASSALAAAWAGRYARQRWVPAMAAIMVAAGGYLGAAYGTVLNFDSPSQAVTTVWLLALSYAVVEYLTGAIAGRALWVVALLAVACVGGKATAAIVLVGALAFAAAVAYLRRESWRHRAVVALSATAVPGAIAYVLVLSGSANSGDLLLFTWQHRASSVQGLDLGYGAWGVLAGTVILMLAVLPRWMGLVGYWMDARSRWSPPSILGVGLIITALVPLLILSQGVNELWFALSASAPLAVLSAIGLALAWGRLEVGEAGSDAPVLRGRWPLVVCAVFGLGVSVVVAVIWAQGESGTVSLRAVGPLVGLLLSGIVAIPIALSLRRRVPRVAAWATVFVTILVIASAMSRSMVVFGRVGSQSATSDVSVVPVVPGVPAADAGGDPAPASGAAPAPPPLIEDFGNSWSELEVEAAEFLKNTSTMDDVIVTDRTVSALVPALTGLRTYLSAAPYQLLYGRPATVAEIPVRSELSKRFVVQPTQADADALCAGGVTIVWATRAPGAAPAPSSSFARVVFVNDAVTILSMDPAHCTVSP